MIQNPKKLQNSFIALVECALPPNQTNTKVSASKTEQAEDSEEEPAYENGDLLYDQNNNLFGQIEAESYDEKQNTESFNEVKPTLSSTKVITFWDYHQRPDDGNQLSGFFMSDAIEAPNMQG